ncbi:hypothetical protein [Wolbachia endosymbiont of Folsomia candida]|uniref:hypothetical protein n=1 Tax=Wolbachia endosymbiont of Folsomia candida TaxID=169402 RepID=UPI000ABE813E|nr:hypothetical protein [Wolbachia endosymbiont of Folsomia candida]APR99080.1 hypothetical protein ASM33_07830 [Wolbachia endosymbiont of Folsomia candida]
MTNITKENIEKEIFKFLNKGGDREFLRYRINNIGGSGFNKEFVDFKNTTHTTNNTKDTCTGVTVNVYHNTNSILDDPFFWLWFSSSISYNNHSYSDSSSSGCMGGDCSSNGDGDGAECFLIFVVVIFCTCVVAINAFATYKICEALSKTKDNGCKIFWAVTAFAVQAAIAGGLIFFIIKANGIFDEKTAPLYQMLAGVNVAISAIACLACLYFIIVALYERYQNSEIAKEYAELAIKNFMSIDENSFNNIPPSGIEATPEPSAPPPPPGFINDVTSQNTSSFNCSYDASSLN